MTTEPGAGAKRAALEAEQDHLHRVHDRVEHLRERADARAAEAAADRSGSTFQARFERDVTAHHHATRAARYTFGDVESLAFGRLDLRDGDDLHVGRISVVDESGDVLLVDWRAPASAAFYQATPATPMDVVRRRTLVTRGRTVRDLDDELLDADAAEELGLSSVTGQGALLAALSRHRTAHMRDIVATIQADQDRIIRSPATGTLVVTGGPGTGKTVVALHRVAYLLYGDRDRFEGRGILVVGPSQAFTEYTARVLPSLGEDRAVQRALDGFAPRGVRVTGWDEPDVAAVKGDLAMIEVCRRAVAAAVPPLPPATRFSFEGTTARLDGRTLAGLRRRLLGRVSSDRDVTTYHARAAAADDALRAALWKAWRGARRAAGARPPEERSGTGFDQALEEAAQVTMLRRCFWPELDPADVLARLASGRVDLDRLAGDLLGAEARGRLHDAWQQAEGWTLDDVALLDEVRAVLGRVPEASTESPRDRDPGLRVTGDPGPAAVAPADVEADDYRDFAHVVVDEAQDLTPMQWRMVARRGPYASWTVVGDLAQRSRVAEPRDWDAVARLIGRRQVAVQSLSVNYRTPAEIVEVARAVLEAADHDPDAVPRAVRESGHRPTLHRTDDLVGVAVGTALDAAARADGTVVLIGPPELLPELTSTLEGAEAEDERRERVRVLDARTVKGLEFDDVVVVAPDRIAEASAVGLHQLYVAVTRATRSLAVVAAPDAPVPGEERYASVRA
ncbi:HelD family protein [Egicoccus halophilus]|uniref:HelD family protein n=1 Tax=Egicoccus halophilus TaxID=1670830 RepID=UPI00102F91CA|nr:UvrD-helicase domain-containing protein [Egicoccus halophilus]